MKSYGQYCGLARALEVVGDRWTLLVVRQLLIAPARYRDLRQALPGVATNLLADRLRDLESVGVVERRVADEGGAVEYALTPWGAELREPVESLIRWSTPLMVRGPEGDAFRPEWLTLALPALLATRPLPVRAVTIALDLGDTPFRLQAGPDVAVVGPPDGRPADATLRAEAYPLLGLAAGALSLDDALALGLVEVTGDTDAVREALAG
ncbi:MAG: helix-turn-helix domain-containing protein [Aeromicrobium sp.]|uniref:winged helix-turn-helix transcriptional regulator n=1 Tax=Aeromicrobium sp. TaxID=1871063 RepID=UPI0039E22037